MGFFLGVLSWCLRHMLRSVDGIVRGESVDVIVPISYTTMPDDLVVATRNNLLGAALFQEECPQAQIVFSSCIYTFPNSKETEDKLKRAYLEKWGVDLERVIVAQGMNNSVSEAFSVRDALSVRGVCPKHILIVTGELHSSSARNIWRRVFPRARISVVASTDYTDEIQEDHPVFDQRRIGGWYWSNIKRYGALRLRIPLSWLVHIQHKAASG